MTTPGNFDRLPAMWHRALNIVAFNMTFAGQDWRSRLAERLTACYLLETHPAFGQSLHAPDVREVQAFMSSRGDDECAADEMMRVLKSARLADLKLERSGADEGAMDQARIAADEMLAEMAMQVVRAVCGYEAALEAARLRLAPYTGD